MLPLQLIELHMFQQHINNNKKTESGFILFKSVFLDKQQVTMLLNK